MLDLDKNAFGLMKHGSDEGESYMHAASKMLQMPILTNDIAAVKLLEQCGAIEPRFLRSFDVLAFGVQINQVSESECDTIKTSMQKKGETIEKAFRQRSFSESLNFFYPRLLDCDLPMIGITASTEPYDQYRLSVKKL